MQLRQLNKFPLNDYRAKIMMEVGKVPAALEPGE